VPTLTKQRKSKKRLVNAENFLDFDWNKVKLFYHIAQCGSFVKTAQVTGVDQPSLTRHIQTLERQVGCPLLVRRAGAKGGVALTRKGEELLAEVTPFFLRMKGFCGHHYVEIGEEKKRKIRIVTTSVLANYVIGDLVLDYNERNPHLVFEVVGEEHAIDVIVNDADITIQPYDSDSGSKGIQQTPLFTLEQKLFASREYLEKHGEPKTVDDLQGHHLIANAVNSGWLLKLGMPEGKRHQPAFTSSSLELAISAAKKGRGIVGSYGAMSILKEANLVTILPEVRGEQSAWYFTCPGYLAEDEEIIVLKEHLTKMMAQ